MQFICNFCGDELLGNEIKTHIEFRCKDSNSFECVGCKKDMGIEDSINHIICDENRDKKNIKLFERKMLKGGVRMDDWLRVIKAIKIIKYSMFRIYVQI